MTIQRALIAGVLAIFLCIPSNLRAAPQAANVRFENSCAADVQPAFSQAITLLHSFEYPETARIFAEIIERDPDCAMSYWGAAMSIWHPLWAPPGTSQLEQGARLLDEAEGLPMTARERGFIDAAKAYFSSSDPASHASRARAHAAAMATVHARHIEDPEAAVFYALALLAIADPQDKSYAMQLRAAAILKWVKESEPTHPGVLHYLIHAYDYPELAYLGLDAARTYAAAAPDSAHAQHMPSHIFTRLGLWDLSLASNRDSTHSAAEYTERAGLPGHYDEGLHSIDYLMYALLQTARDDAARELLERLAEIDSAEPESFKVAYTYAAAPARYMLERRAWEDAAELQLIRAADFPWRDFGWAQSIHHFARGIGAARSGQVAKATAELEAIRMLQRELPAGTVPYWGEEVRVHIDALDAWIAFAEGREEEALERARAAADREDAVDKHPVTPGEVLPARELYADLLSAAGRHADAAEQYRTVLRGSPNRLNALLGAEATARALGDSEEAERLGTLAREQTRAGNHQRSGLARLWDPPR